MTFFYNLNKKLDEIRATPETTHKQLNERDEGKPGKNFAKISADAAKRYGSKEAGNRVAGAVRAKLAKQGKLEEELDEGFVDTVKSGAQAALSAIGQTMGHGSDEDMIRDLQKKAGLPQTGKVPLQQPGQQPTTAGQQPMAEATAPIDFDKVLNAIAALHGPDIWDNDAMQDLANDLEQAGPTDQELDFIIAKGKLPKRLAGTQFSAGDDVQFGEGVDKQAFAALAPPKDKITFADKIAGAKKEVDEMLGDVAAEAMKNALSGGQKKLDKNKNGKLDKQDFAMLRGGREETDEGWDDMLKDVKARREKTKKGEITHGHKHDIEDTGTGRRVTRRTDPNTGYSVGAEDDKPADGEKRGRGRPKKADKAPERVTAKAYKHKGGRKEKVKEGSDEGVDMVKLAKVIASCKTQAQLDTARRMAQNFLKKHQTGDLAFYGDDMKRGMAVSKDIASKRDEIGGVEEEAVSKAQRKAAGIAHAAQKGEIPKSKLKGASKEMAKMPKGELKKFASTKEKGLPNKKEKTEETTVSGSVAPAAGGKAKKGGIVGKGIYDSLNRDLEAMISESMNVSVNMSMDENGEPRKNITVSAEGEAAEQLAQLLNLAGMAAQEDHGCGCETSPCSCGSEEELDENQPDWPTNQETTGEDDPEMRRWAGGVNGPKSTGQTVGAPFNRQDQRQGVMGEGVDLGMKLYAELKSFKG